jgi:hypothetical protein
MTPVEQPFEIFQLTHWLVVVKSSRVTDQGAGICTTTIGDILPSLHCRICHGRPSIVRLMENNSRNGKGEPHGGVVDLSSGNFVKL